MKLVHLLFIFGLVMATSVLAVDVSLAKTDYNSGDIVVVSVSGCSGTSLLLIENPYDELIALSQNEDNWQYSYNTLSDSLKGQYNLTVNCADGTNQQSWFCLNSAGCELNLPEPEPPQNWTYDELEDLFLDYNETYPELRDDFINFSLEEESLEELIEIESDKNESNIIDNLETNLTYVQSDLEDAKTELNTLKEDLKVLKKDVGDYTKKLENNNENETLINQSEKLENQTSILYQKVKNVLNGKSEDYIPIINVEDECLGNITCDSWSFCTADLKKVRTCTDNNDCIAPYNQTLACDACIESWICGVWSSCSGNQQTRSCLDEHFCGAVLNKPELSRSCSDSGSSSGGSSGSGISNTNSGNTLSDSELEQNQDLYFEPTDPNDVLVEGELTDSKDLVGNQKKSSIDVKDILFILGSLFLLIVIVVLSYLIYTKLNKKKVSPELSGYILRQRVKGATNQQIRQALMNSGWSDDDVNLALRKK